MRARPPWLCVLLLPFLGGCADPPATDDPDARELDYAAELQVDFDAMERTSSGLYLRDVEPGAGTEAEGGRLVAVHYTGSLPDGTVFDSSRERGEPFSFQLGAGQVIPGWEEGIEGMREGGRRTLVIPPHLAYGETGAGGVIPPNAVLVFDVELLEVL